MVEREIVVIGGGPAGLSAAIAASSLGLRVLVLDRNSRGGGQLVKQTHKFFGSKSQYASTRGIDIANIMLKKIENNPNIEIMYNTTTLGFYKDDMVITAERGENEYIKIKAKRVIVATGANEKFIPFINNDLPGVYGAGAVQTLMNEEGVIPGKNVLMVGSGNIGLIVSYQLMQAGVNVKAIIEAAPYIGGYLVHAAKIRRMGVPILTSRTILKAEGKEFVSRATIVKLDELWRRIPGTESVLNVDVICIAVGLSPLAELLWQAGCSMKYIPELGGHVPIRDCNLETSIPGVYVAGDVSGIEEASSAMVEGMLAGICAAMSLGYGGELSEKMRLDAIRQLDMLRSGPTGEKIRKGLEKLA